MHIRLPSALHDILSVSAGAVVGANLRYWMVAWLSQRFPPTFPYGTLFVNVTGSLVLGFLVTLTTQRYLIDPHLRMALTVGLLGSYTTFSTYEYESGQLILSGHWLGGLLDLEGSALLGFVSVTLGIALARLVGGR